MRVALPTQYSFNSKLVRLKVSTIWFYLCCARFQFQTGSIKSAYLMPLHEVDLEFQFQTGSIKSDRKNKQTEINASFNSKLVRLKAHNRRWLTGSCHRFNSKLVRLKDSGHPSTWIIKNGFNSKLVRLKARKRNRWGCGLIASFNSKLVRLKVRNELFGNEQNAMFQFQTGSIKRKRRDHEFGLHRNVSIPNWFD